jgi:hypothetical protein
VEGEDLGGGGLEEGGGWRCRRCGICTSGDWRIGLNRNRAGGRLGGWRPERKGWLGEGGAGG